MTYCDLIFLVNADNCRHYLHKTLEVKEEVFTYPFSDRSGKSQTVGIKMNRDKTLI